MHAGVEWGREDLRGGPAGLCSDTRAVQSDLQRVGRDGKGKGSGSASVPHQREERPEMRG